MIDYYELYEDYYEEEEFFALCSRAQIRKGVAQDAKKTVVQDTKKPRVQLHQPFSRGLLR